jgi:ABC-type polysaccharide/polyol phosphate transport system ATPase subunit
MIKAEGTSKEIQTQPLTFRPAKKRSSFRKQYHKEVVAPGNITFEIGERETPGIIGQNRTIPLDLIYVIPYPFPS